MKVGTGASLFRSSNVGARALIRSPPAPLKSYTKLHGRTLALKRASLILTELLHRQRQAKTVEDARLITLKKEPDHATNGLDRLYQAAEEDALSIDEMVRVRRPQIYPGPVILAPEFRNPERSVQSPSAASL